MNNKDARDLIIEALKDEMTTQRDIAVIFSEIQMNIIQNPSQDESFNEEIRLAVEKRWSKKAWNSIKLQATSACISEFLLKRPWSK